MKWSAFNIKNVRANNRFMIKLFHYKCFCTHIKSLHVKNCKAGYICRSGVNHTESNIVCLISVVSTLKHPHKYHIIVTLYLHSTITVISLCTHQVSKQRQRIKTKIRSWNTSGLSITRHSATFFTGLVQCGQQLFYPLQCGHKEQAAAD